MTRPSCTGQATLALNGLAAKTIKKWVAPVILWLIR
jgi:hypothetical protein